jgi:hypothetical protein
MGDTGDSSKEGGSMLRVTRFHGDPEKWTEFKETFEAVAGVLGFLEVLLPDAVRPEENVAGAAWDKRNREAYARLILCTKGTAQGIVKKHRGTRSGLAAYRDLVTKYEETGELRISMLHDKLINGKMEKYEDPEGYFLRLEEIQLRLSELGVEVSDATLKGLVMSKMPSGYDVLRVVIGTKGDVSYDQLKEHMRAFYARHVTVESLRHKEAASALETRAKPFDGACLNCGEPGHRAASCREPKKCFKCKQPGHLRRNCPQSAQQPAQQQQQQTNCAQQVITF